MNSDNLKASPILYMSSVTMLFLGVMLPLIDTAQRFAMRDSYHNLPEVIRSAGKGRSIKALTDLIELNIFSEWGMILIILGLFHFWLAIKVDGRECHQRVLLHKAEENNG